LDDTSTFDHDGVRTKPFEYLDLVVDDDQDARTIFRQYLRMMGCRVVTASGLDLGSIREVVHTTANDVWVADGAGGEVEGVGVAAVGGKATLVGGRRAAAGSGMYSAGREGVTDKLTSERAGLEMRRRGSNYEGRAGLSKGQPTHPAR